MICDDSVVFYGYYDNKTNRYDIVEILLKVALNTIILATSPLYCLYFVDLWFLVTPLIWYFQTFLAYDYLVPLLLSSYFYF